ncbi:hypothetical protein [Phenylobacterium sp.]|uniref:hypothetical protein n=1 Tax=Phenylobacterium sp. TaxID=1871053 RepID=UPI00286C6E93|nr:hypothetical protein [Phenylobacterium sp.]
MTSPATDNRRAVVRVLGHEILRTLSSMARLHDGDMIALLIFTGIWTINSQHLIGETNRYAALRDIPPDSQRRPATLGELGRLVAIPEPILRDYVERLIEQGRVERTSAGLLVPSAVFTQSEMLDASNELYTDLVTMVSALRDAGFRFGEAA